MQIDFTTTACIRPAVFYRTLSSFRDNLTGLNLCDCVLYLNVDPLPAGGDPDAVVKVATQFFGGVVVRKPTRPNFAAAVRWLWRQPAGRWLFHLEDDWEMLRPVPISELLRIMVLSPELACVSLRAYHWPPDESRICLSPGLFNSHIAAAIAEKLNTVANPEKQLRPVAPDNPHGGAHEFPGGCYKGEQYPIDVAIRDHGREWLAKNGYRKATMQNDQHFIVWERAK